MKYKVITTVRGKVRSNAIAKINDDTKDWDVVAETRTMREAKAILEANGGWITLA